jgi:hypothetical protein
MTLPLFYDCSAYFLKNQELPAIEFGVSPPLLYCGGGLTPFLEQALEEGMK